ncbi:hypothetical protein SAMN04244553_3619 [Nocardia amikacinitolerans]|uniref:Uncharacterized protein n=1 Tax=Nocardia amikacinitolerans TaxID=756689 RepID=A0A285LHF9_9NOCA|nr:hypothetical protein [Nocardia amikacinitolerans]SNY84334.1 hypothetical protein SAMN04244553_3619 [Nocardia amikacinitolerans]
MGTDGDTDDLDRALAEVARARLQFVAAEEHLRQVMLEMLRSGKRGVQAELVRRTGWSREYLRQLAREHGL